jgi:NADH-quinone oxidoreductase subunit G
VSPHDALGSNLVVQVKENRVLRVLPLENEAVNECWISDKDRFSYEALNSAERLTAPMVKQGGEWKTVDWQAALDHVANGLSDIITKHGAGAVGALVSPHATLEEQTLVARLMRALGSDNVDFRLRQTDFSEEGNRAGIPWLGLPIAEINALDRVLVIGSFLRKDQPLIAQRLRQAAKKGAQVSMLHAVDDDWLIPLKHKAIVPPSLLPSVLAEIVVAAARGAGKPVPATLSDVEPAAAAEVIAASLLTGQKRAIFLGNFAAQHAAAAQLAALAQALAEICGATPGVLTEAANSVGGYVARALPQSGGKNAQTMLAEPRKAYLLMHVEPEFDCANPVAARSALEKAELVVVMSPFKHGTSYADVLLPVAPFTETSGSFINCEGRLQSFRGVVPPQGDTRPGWKVLRVLGTMFNLPGFDADTSEEIRDTLLADTGPLASRLDNATRIGIVRPTVSAAPVERVADVPIYFADALVRRAASLQQTADARAPRARMHRSLLDKLGIAEGAQVKVKQGRGEAVLAAVVDRAVPPGVVRIAAAHASTCGLEGLSGPVSVERA